MKRSSLSFTRRRLLEGAAASAALLLPGMADAAENRPPNILFIMADDMGYADLSCYGSRHIRTPALDRLAAQGIRFTDAYANAPVCSPTRLALITGLYHQRFRTGLVEPFSAGPWGDQAIPAGQPTLPALLRHAGYHTSLIGKWHLGETEAGSPLSHGYDEFFGILGGGTDYFTHEYRGKPSLRRQKEGVTEKGYITTLLADEVIASLRRSANTQQPFFMSLHFNAPHWPWEGPEDSALGTQGPMFNGGSLATYAEMMESMDRNIGRILRELDILGLDQDTLVVFTSDNGGERFSETWPFRGMKGSLLEGGIRVPAILRYPRTVRAGQESDQPLISLDWMPTFLEAAAISPRKWPKQDGIPVLSTLEKGGAKQRDLFWRTQGHNQRALRQGNWKYYQIGDTPFLFDLSADTMERANRAKAEPERLRAMAARWDEWNRQMVTATDAPGFCFTKEQMAEPIDMSDASNCKKGPGE